MCGRIVQKSGPAGLSIVEGMEAARPAANGNHPPRYNGAPAQEHLVIRRNHASGEITLAPIRWGFIPVWCDDARGGVKPINARAETVKSAPMFKAAYRRRRCVVPVDAFFEWRAIGGLKQPYAIALKSGAPFGLAGLWENWKNPQGAKGEAWVRSFAIITTAANELMRAIHHRMPVILHAADQARWLSEAPEADDLLRPFDANLMRMWPVSRRVNKVSEDDAGLIEEMREAG